MKFDFDAHQHLVSTAERNVLPEHRRMSTGRTYASLWNPLQDAIAVQRYRRRTSAIDRLCWLASGLLLAASAWVVWG